jgi:hypothetical protein
LPEYCPSALSGQAIGDKYPFPISHAYAYLESRADPNDRYQALLACPSLWRTSPTTFRKIPEDLNRAFGGEGVNGDAPVAIQHLLGKLVENVAIQKSLEVNPPDTARLTFNHVAEQLFAEMVDNYYTFYKRVTDNPQAQQRLFEWLFEQYRSAREQDQEE